MQNTEVKERYCKRPRRKGQSKNNYKVQCDAQAETVTKGVVQKLSKDKW